ncbi:solute carrier family 12 member 8-like isoform X1 [Centruroides sculpturatus]|uniref:solute carrier family 12 member 8-like isoform X1 n=1 Tax=Centruroides sculpturatus TaxID=218467 RepID=UPI000C6CCB3E|nr:solute carrier family 12 member 8-like isoform X1 [Centruroides sculpturatus]
MASKTKSEVPSVNWERYGLSSTPTSSAVEQWKTDEDQFLNKEYSDKWELFHEDQNISNKPWWKANFFLSKPVLFGTWDGVFTSCMINLFSVIVFLRIGWIVGNAGIIQSVAIVLMTVIICTITALAAIGICERCHVESGGVHFIIAHVLGAQFGGAVSIVYCFGQAVSCALHVIGFAESVSQLLKIANIWLQRLIATLLIILLLGINLAGVKWVIRLQFALLIVLLLAALDFAVGTFVHINPESGVTGYNLNNFYNNSGPQYLTGENWFTVFGIFFPAMTGILAGVNMGGDLYNPSKDIPVGTLASIGTSLFIYMMFIMGLGATCERHALQTDYLIAEKVSSLGVMFLAGLYISSMSTCLGSLYATPRIIQSIANEKVIPLIKFLAHGKGPNKVPVFALILFSVITVIFILIGEINTLAPIVTIPYLLTYAAIEYAYFSLAMTFDMQRQREEKFGNQQLLSPDFVAQSNGFATDITTGKIIMYGSTNNSKYGDLDHLFPERLGRKSISHRGSQSTITESPLTSPDDHSSVCTAASKDTETSKSHADSASSLLGKGRLPIPEITSKSSRWYSYLSNRWIAFLGVLIKLVIMFLVHWIYALATIVSVGVIFYYIGHVSPGSYRGVSEFKFFQWIKNCFFKCKCCGSSSYDQIIVATSQPEVEVLAAQLTEENSDYASREPYHHSMTVKTLSQHHIDSD